MSAGDLLLLLLILHFFAPHKLSDLPAPIHLAFIQKICELCGSLYRKVMGKLDWGLLCARPYPTWFLGCKGGPLNKDYWFSSLCREISVLGLFSEYVESSAWLRVDG